jgi:hypothetical protein
MVHVKDQLAELEVLLVLGLEHAQYAADLGPVWCAYWTLLHPLMLLRRPKLLDMYAAGL